LISLLFSCTICS